VKKKVQQLVELLESYAGTAEFLQDVTNAIEHVYAESESDAAAGFTALDDAINAFAEAET